MVATVTYYGDDGPNEYLGIKSNKDIVYGRGGGDIIRTGEGNDTVYEFSTTPFDWGHLNFIDAGAGNDAVYADGAAYLYADLGAGNDLFYGTHLIGDYTITGGNGNDKIYAYVESDFFHTGVETNVTIDGGADNDYIYVNSIATDGMTNAFGGSGDDTMVSVGTGNVVMYGGDGDDMMRGGNATDTLFGDAGQDRLYGGSSGDNLYGGDNSDYLSGGAGDDVLFGDAGSDTIEGGSGADVIYGGEGDDFIFTGSGVKGGVDYVRGDEGHDTIYLQSSGDKEVDFGLGGLANGDTVIDAAGLYHKLTLDGSLVGSHVDLSDRHFTALTIGSDGTYHFTGGPGRDYLDVTMANHQSVPTDFFIWPHG